MFSCEDIGVSGGGGGGGGSGEWLNKTIMCFR